MIPFDMIDTSKSNYGLPRYVFPDLIYSKDIKTPKAALYQKMLWQIPFVVLLGALRLKGSVQHCVKSTYHGFDFLLGIYSCRYYLSFVWSLYLILPYRKHFYSATLCHGFHISRATKCFIYFTHDIAMRMSKCIHHILVCIEIGP